MNARLAKVHAFGKINLQGDGLGRDDVRESCILPGFLLLFKIANNSTKILIEVREDLIRKSSSATLKVRLV